MFTKRKVQGGEDAWDASSCRSLPTKEPPIIGLFWGKWPERKTTWKDKASYGVLAPCIQESNIYKKEYTSAMLSYRSAIFHQKEGVLQKRRGFTGFSRALYTQGGEDPLDVLSCRSFSAKEPLVLGLFWWKTPFKNKASWKGLRHPVPQTLSRFGKGYIWIQESITLCKISKMDIYIYIYMYLYTNLESF